MAIEIMHMSANARLIRKVLTKYRNTFYALKELINNSIIAKAKRIEITFGTDADVEPDTWNYQQISHIIIRDNGHGVPFCDFYKSIMEIGTDNREDGCGVGRFGGLQIGRVMTIDTTAYDPTIKSFTKTTVKLTIDDFQGDDVTTKRFEVNKTILSGDSYNSYYEVKIESLYHNEGACAIKNKLLKEFLSDDLFANKLFQHYPLYIFNEDITFVLNGKGLRRLDFVKGTPIRKETNYTDVFGKNHTVYITYYPLSITDSKVRLFLQVKEGDVDTTALELAYNSMWYSPIMGAQYIIIQSDYITKDLCENFALADFREKEWDSFGTFIKTTIDEHYKKDNVKYKSFVEELIADKSYPFTKSEIENTSIVQDVFNQSAFYLEEDLKLIERNSSSKKLLFALLRKVIEDGDITFLIQNVMGLSKESQRKLIELLDRSKLEDIVAYSSNVAKKLTTLETLYQITVTNISKSIEARSNVDTMLAKELWILGEEYKNTIGSNIDQNTEELLNNLYNSTIASKPSKKDDNLLPEVSRGVKAIKDQVVYNERYTGGSQKEILIVNIRQPSCHFGQVDMAHVDRYVYDLQTQSHFVKRNVSYKVFVIVNQLSQFARSQINTTCRDRNEPFLYKEIVNDEVNIKVYIVEWSELIAHNKLLLSSMSETLRIKQINAQALFLNEYKDLIERKNKGKLSIIK